MRLYRAKKNASGFSSSFDFLKVTEVQLRFHVDKPQEKEVRLLKRENSSPNLELYTGFNSSSGPAAIRQNRLDNLKGHRRKQTGTPQG